jgi:putative oxidoreductase
LRELLACKADHMVKTIRRLVAGNFPPGGEIVAPSSRTHEKEFEMLSRILGPRTETVYAAMRIIVGLLFAFHGIQKIFGVLTEFQPSVGSQLWIGGLIELVAGFLIAFGFLTVWAAFLASGTMAVAYLQYHWKFAFNASFFPTVNKGELALVYAFLFLYIACRGAGTASIDSKRTPVATD